MNQYHIAFFVLLTFYVIYWLAKHPALPRRVEYTRKAEIVPGTIETIVYVCSIPEAKRKN
jgi:hypothetical protein